MSKFNQLLIKTGKQYLLTEADLGVPQGDEQSAIPQVQNSPPQAEPQPAAEPEKLTPEGKRYLISLCLKALGTDPSKLSEQDKSILNEEVTPENADEILKRIQNLVDANDFSNISG